MKSIIESIARMLGLARLGNQSVVFGVVLALCTSPAFAVHDEDFELDTGADGANIVDDDTNDNPPIDWSSLFDVVGDNKPTAKADLPPNFGTATFIRDFVPVAEGRGIDRSVFTSGSADVNDVSTWSCTTKSNLGGKFNILNAYATAYSDPISGDTILYFALERSANEGTAAAGWWFLQDGSVACEDTDGGQAEDFTGTHQVGDLLVIADFTDGGKVGEVLVYEWNGSGLTLRDSGADCADAAPGDRTCATMNRVTLQGKGPGTDIPWLTESKTQGNTPSNDLEERLFIEGGVNLTANDLDRCFATFLATTRSSTSTTSEKHDYAIGSFPLCKVELSKICSQEGGYNPITGNIEIPYSVTVKNTASSVVESVVATDDQCGLGESVLNFGPIAAGGEETQDGLCSIQLGTDLSALFNGVSATASEGVTIELADSCVTREGEPGVCFAACNADADPAIDATKNCVTALVAEDGVVKVKVNFSGSVSNTSDAPQCLGGNGESGSGMCVSPAGQSCALDSDCGTEPIPLINVTALDNKAGALTLLDAPGGSPLPTPVTLDPGVTAYFEGSYLPDGSGAGFSECPSNASFDDTVTASGVDAAFGVSVEDSAMANCKLCPPEGCPTP